ncbi:glypican-5-like [Amphiura filiformis]|uniref:glypican-5-like n=1 Tax=Amphiura filiformis TaxID=82378 RepID=UPI003B2178A0
MAGDYDLQLAIHSLDANIIDAISTAKDDSERIIEEVNNLCRTLGDRGRPSPAQNRDFAIQQPSHSIPMAPNPSMPLDERLLAFVDSLDSSRMLYSSLSRGLCSEGLMAAARSNDGCWNGDEVDRYSEAIVDDGLVAQRASNPEVSWNGRELELLQAMSLMDKLQHVVQSQETWARNQADFILNMDQDFSGSGSGDEMECSGDDEECEGSGSDEMTMSTMPPDSNEDSGEARTTPDSDFTFEPSKHDSDEDNEAMVTKATKGKGSGNIGEKNPGGGATQTSTVSASLITIAFLLSWQHLL